MKLYYSHASPYARTSRVMLREKNLSTQVQECEVNPLVDPAELIANNPLGKIPCLLLDNGEALFDSVVINDYFNSIGAAPDLFAAHKTSFQIKKWQAASQGLLDVAVQLRIEKTKPENTQSAVWMTRNHNAILRSAVYLQSLLAQLPGAGFLPLHIACALGYLDFRHADIDWRSSAPELAAWFADIRQRPSLRDTEPH